MNIQVRVVSGPALAAMAKITAADRAMAASMASSSAAAGRASLGFIGRMKAMDAAMGKWGMATQYAGRQLMYNFTLPLVLAGGMAAKWALENEAALVRVKKVYGDATNGSVFYRKEIESLDKAFEALSNQFGISRADVTNIAADWAAAGSSGVALAKATKLTMETMILGEMKAEEATKALISIQAQYGQTVEELSVTIDTLNMIENQTGITMQGLIDGFQRAAGVSRAAGIDVRHLGAMMAALVPASGGAAQAGNAIKTIISRLMSPTKEAAEVMGMFGIKVKDAAWQSMNGAQQLEFLAGKYQKLSDKQKIVVSTTLGSRFQMNKLIVLMNDMNNKTGYYHKSLDSTSSATQNYKQKVQELNQVLDSNPRKLQIIWTNLKNMMTDVIQPLIPIITGLAATLVSWFKSFQNLNPALQKFIGVGLLLLALTGPLLRYLGAVATLFRYMFASALMAVKGITWVGISLGKLVLAPFKLIWSGLTAIGNAAIWMGTSLVNGVKTAIAGLIGLFTKSVPVVTMATAFEAAEVTIIASTEATTSGVVALWSATEASLVVITETIAVSLGGMTESILYTATKVIPSAMSAITGVTAVMSQEVVLVTTVAATRVQMIWTESLGYLTGIFQVSASGIITVVGAFYATLIELTAATGANVIAIWFATSTELVVITTAASGQLLAIWSGTYLVLTEGTATYHTYWITEWYIVYADLLAITTGTGTALVSMWAAIWTELVAITAAGQLAIESGFVAIGTSAIAMAGTVAVASQAAATSVMVAGAEVVAVGPAVLTGFARIGPAIMAFFAGIGPALARAGVFILTAFTRILPLIRTVLSRIVIALAGWWSLAFLTLLGVVYAFKDKLVNAWDGVVSWFQNNASGIAVAFRPLVDFFNGIVSNIEKAFWRLPMGIQNAFMAVVRIVQRAAIAVKGWMSNLNPFQRHSPSLVDNVKKGMGVIADQHQTVAKSSPVAETTKHLTQYKTATAKLTGGGSGSGGFADELGNVTKSLPSMLPLFNVLLNDLAKMNRLLAIQQAAVDGQQAVVDAWKVKLNAANKALDTQTTILDGLQKKLDLLTNAYDAHKTAMEGYANAPIQGMKAMNDAIWSNDMAQKALQLQMLQMDGGENLDKLRSKYAALQGEIEGLAGTQNELRMAGAGSEITSAYDTQIKALQAQQVAVNNSAGPLQSLQDQLDALQHSASIMDLERDLKFGPLTKQIDELVNGMKELPFNEIIAGITREQAAMAALQPQIDLATAAVDKQKLAVEAATAARDAVSSVYDTENAKLQALNDTYSKTEKLVRDIESALRDMGSAASQAGSAAKAKADKVLTPGGQNFKDSASGNFPDVGGTGVKIGREGGAGNQNALIDQWVKDNTKGMGDLFTKIDMFKPIKDMWNSTWKWVEVHIGPTLSPLVQGVKDTWKSLFGSGDQLYMGDGKMSAPDTGSLSKVWDGVSAGASKEWDKVSKVISNAWNNSVMPIVRLFAPDFQQAWDAIVGGAKKIWNEIGPEIAKFGASFKDLGPALKKVWDMMQPSIGLFLAVLKVVTSTLANTLGPVIDTIIDIIKGAIQVIRGVFEVIVGLLSGDWKNAWQGIVDILAGVWEAVFAVIWGAVKIIWGIVSGLVMGVINFFKWLWDELVGHSIIPDMINAIVEWFKNAGIWVIDHVKTLVNGVIEWFKLLPGRVWDAVILIKDKLGEVMTTAFNWMRDRASAGWTVIWTWLKSLPQATWDAIILIKDKIGEVASTAFAWMKEKAVAGWNIMVTWIKGIPQAAWDAIIAIKDKLGSAAVAAFQALKDKAVEMVDGKNGFMTWIKGIPGKVADGLSNIGASVANAVKDAWNGVANFINKSITGRINVLLAPFNFQLGQLPTFAKGGIVPGGISATDNMLIAARSGEGILVPEAVRALGGAAGIAALNKMGLQGFAQGGIVGSKGKKLPAPIHAAQQKAVLAAGKGIPKPTDKSWVDNIDPELLLKQAAGAALGAVFNSAASAIAALLPGKGFIEDLTVGMMHDWARHFQSWADGQAAAATATAAVAGSVLPGSADLGGMGFNKQMEILRSQFPGLALYSGFRAGARTSSGGLSYHAQGRAVDVPPRMDVFNWIRSIYGASSAELIFTPAGSRQIKNGLPYTYSGQVAADHYKHVHWAYDEGGWLQPGDSGRNRSGKPEPVFSSSQWAILTSLVTTSSTVLKSLTTGELGAGIGLRGGLANAQSRMSQTSMTSSTTSSGTGHTTINFNGDISLPNIKNGEDAETFLKNLKSLAGAA